MILKRPNGSSEADIPHGLQYSTACCADFSEMVVHLFVSRALAVQIV